MAAVVGSLDSGLGLTGMPRRDVALPLLLLGPAALWTLVFFVAPLSVMLWRSLQRDGLSLFYYRKLFSVSLYLDVMLNTFQISLIVTAGCLLLGYPLAYLICVAGPRARAIVLVMVITPYWLDYIVRSYSWMVLLGRTGLVNRTMISLGLIEQPITILFTVWSVAIGMIQILLPLTILTLYATMQGIDRRLLQAAAIHGAPPWRAFARVFFPLSLPGVYGAGLLTFVTAMGFYITPALLGGRKQTMISQLIATLSNELLDWPLASAAAALLLFLSLLIVLLYNRLFSVDRLWGGAPS